MNTFNQSTNQFTPALPTLIVKSAVGAYWKVKQYQVNQEKSKAIVVMKTHKGMLLTVWYL